MGGRSKKSAKTKRVAPTKKRRLSLRSAANLWLWVGLGWIYLALSGGQATAQEALNVGAAARLGQTVAPSGQATVRRELAPVVFGSNVLGHVTLDFLANGAVSLDADELYRIADPVLGDEDRALLRALSEAGRLTPFQMHFADLNLVFDESRNALILSAPGPADRSSVLVPLHSPPPSAAPETMTPLMWNGERLGFIGLSIDSGRVSFPAERFAALAAGALSPGARALLPAIEREGRLTPFSLSSADVHVRYDDGAAILILESPGPPSSAEVRLASSPPLAPDVPRPILAHSQAASPSQTPPASLEANSRASLQPAPTTPVSRDEDRVVSVAADGTLLVGAATLDAIAYTSPAAPAFPHLHAAANVQFTTPSPGAPELERSAGNHFVAPSTTSPSIEVAQLSPPPATAALQPAEPQQPTQAPPAQRAAPPPSQLEFVYPLMVDERYLGDVPVRFDADGAISFPADRTRELIGPLLDPLVVDSIVARGSDGRLRPFEDQASGVGIIFDEAMQELRLIAPGSIRRNEVISIAGARSDGDAEARLERPAPVAAFVTLDVTQAYNHDALGSGREPLQGIIDTGLRLFGNRGVALEARGFYDEGGAETLRRGEARLVYDHVPSMISASLGDLRYGAAEFQAAPPMGGLLVERLFSLQPHRNFRPAGRRAFVLDRRTFVTVVVNGAEVRRLDLPPGRYELEDFPFAEGANDVSLILEDEFGRRDIIDMRGYFDIELLEPGVSEFSYAIGAPSTSEAEGIRYDTDIVQYSMFHRIGVLSNLTLGVNAQGRDDAHLYGAEVLVASPIGTMGLDVAHSTNPLVGEGDAVLFRYELMPQPSNGFSWNFGFSSQWQSQQFSSIDSGAAFGIYELQHDATLRLYHPEAGALTLSAALDQPFAGDIDRTEASIGYSRRLFGTLFGSVQVSHIAEGESEETTASLSLTLRLGRRHQITARHNTRTSVSELDWYRAGSYGVGGISANARVGVNQDTDEIYGGGAVSYYGNRFDATLTSDSRTAGIESDEISTRSSMRVGASLAYAGSRVALGRPIRGAFAVVGPHESLDGHQVILGGGDDRPRAVTGLFGPALIPDLAIYTHEVVGVDVENLPPGYDLGAGQLDFRAYRNAGYNIDVGSAASVTVLATLLGPDGAPVALVGGELRSLDEPEREPVQAFSNRAGRLVAAGVAPGRYRLVLVTDPVLQAEVIIAEGSVGLVQLGAIQMQEAQ